MPKAYNNYNAPIKLSSSGAWSATRPNQDNYSKKAKIHVTGVFTSPTGGHGTWQVVGCTAKHTFKFTINVGGSGA